MKKKIAGILCGILTCLFTMTGCDLSNLNWDAFHTDHGEVVDLDLYTSIDKHDTYYDGKVLDSGSNYIWVHLIYEDGCTDKESTNDWTVKEPVTLDINKANVITVCYGDIEKDITIGPAEPFYMEFDNSVNYSQDELDIMKLETIMENYPGHGSEYYLDLLMDSGMPRDRAYKALAYVYNW